MTNLQELSYTVQKLCQTIDQSIKMERFFTDEINMHLENMTRDADRMAQELKQIRTYCEVGYV